MKNREVKVIIKEIKEIEKTYTLDLEEMSKEDKKLFEEAKKENDEEKIIELTKKYSNRFGLTEDIEDLDWVFQDTKPVELIGIEK